MYFAYVLNREFGWPMTGTFMESPVDPEKGMPGEVGDFTDYDTEKVMFGHVWVQATPDIAVDIEGAKNTNKMKERWVNYPYTHVTSITPEWMGEFFKTNYPNAQARRSVWKRALKAANLLRSHLKGEGLAESNTNERSEFKFAQKIPKINLVSFLNTVNEDEDDNYDPWANEAADWVEIGWIDSKTGKQFNHRSDDYDLPPHSLFLAWHSRDFGLEDDYLASVLGHDTWAELIQARTEDATLRSVPGGTVGGDTRETIENHIRSQLEQQLNGLYAIPYSNGWIRYGGDGKELQITSTEEALKHGWSTSVLQMLIRELGKNKVQISDMYAGLHSFGTGYTFLKNFDLTTEEGKAELAAWMTT
jgi:hypothetical protein